MAKKESEPKLIFEREYIVPLRKGWLKVPEYKRANKAIKTLKEFMVRHMKIYDKDLRKVKIDVYLNNEIRFRGIKKPHSKIKVKARKFDNDIVKVELVNLPKHIEFKKKREEKLNIKKEEKEDNKKVELEPIKENNKIDKDKEVKEENKKDSVSIKGKKARDKNQNKSDAIKKS